MRHIKRLDIAIIVSLTIILIFIGPLRLQKELHISTQWAAYLDDQNQAWPSPDAAVFLSMPGRIVAVDATGAYRSFPVQDTYSLGQSRFSVYDDAHTVVQVKDAKGAVVSSYDASAVPVFSGNQTFLVDRGGTSFSLWDAQGNLKFARQFDDLIIALEVVATTDVAVLLLGGTVVLFDDAGRELSRWKKSGSRVPIGYALISSNDGRLFVYGGIDPQGITALEYGKDGILHESWFLDCKSDLRRDVLLKELDGGRLLAVEKASGFILIDTQSHQGEFIECQAWITGIHDIPALNMLAVLTESNAASSVQLFSYKGHLMGTLGPFSMVHDAALTDRNLLILGGDDGLMAYRIEEK